MYVSGGGGVAKEWFENYLYNGKQIVKYNEVQSEEMTIRSGVRQGSVLGPVRFLLYILNDTQYSFSGVVSIVLFADDTNILYSHTCLKKLNEIIQIEMNKITEWLNATLYWQWFWNRVEISPIE